MEPALTPTAIHRLAYELNVTATFIRQAGPAGRVSWSSTPHLQPLRFPVGAGVPWRRSSSSFSIFSSSSSSSFSFAADGPTFESQQSQAHASPITATSIGLLAPHEWLPRRRTARGHPPVPTKDRERAQSARVGVLTASCDNGDTFAGMMRGS
jgi:hypothetical protein